ncbi:MAG: hypothetical protein J3K34DRAFT_213570 [Monoraphidium minutum]|nr:MAG: hypothetical protein J3K34DRAFT_213570 [Monoraphidium minutum]
MDTYTLNEKGEKVIVPSRRPDGTLRKERRVRAGYTPQDEQPAYVSVGAAIKVGGPRCPGYDAARDAGASAAAKSKAAKKNEKRKVKKAEGHDGGGGGGGGAAAAAGPPSPAPAAAAGGGELQLDPIGGGEPGGGGGGGGGAAGAAISGPAAAVDRQIKALSKKVRQCQALATREKGGGEALSSQEREKLEKMPGWEKEIRELQRMMAQLSAGQ